jgi:antitoxin (DNA-binding transcriptional repressor) of toxin-antitoxin stability system
MDEISISKFKATCLAVLEKVRRTGQPIRVTRFGKAVAEIVPSMADSDEKFHLGGMEEKLTIVGDIMSPVVGPEVWEVLRDEAPAGHARLDLERRQTGTRAGKSPRRTRKSR